MLTEIAGLPTATPTRTLSPDELTALPLTLPPVQLSTPAEVPTVPAPTLDVTPTILVVTVPVTVTSPPIVVTATPQPLPTSTATVAAPPIVPPTDVPDIQITSQPPLVPFEAGPVQYGFQIGTNGGSVFALTPFSLPQNPVLIAQNPLNPNQYVEVNGTGQMFFVRDFASGVVERIDLPPFTDFVYEATQREDNNAIVSDAVWSLDGTVALVIDGDNQGFDGVWFWSPDGGGAQVVRDCPPENGCMTVLDHPVDQWESLSVQWSPDSSVMLVRLNLPTEGRQALILVPRTQNVEQVPPLLRYDYGSWASNGQIVVSGRDPEGNMVLGLINPDGSPVAITNMGQLGFGSVQDGVAYNGRLYAFAAPTPGAPVQLVDVTGRRITEPIGLAGPERIRWSPDRSAALVVTNENGRRRTFVVSVTAGQVREITQQVADALTVDWVPVPSLAPGEAGATLPAPAPVTFAINQQVVVLRQVFLRPLPSTGANSEAIRVLQPGEVLTIVGGPVEAEGLTWYTVIYNATITGWVAYSPDDPSIALVGG